MTIGFLLCVAAGFFLQPYAWSAVKKLGSIQLRSTPTHLVVERKVQCANCVQWLANSLKLFPEFDFQPLCFRCAQKRRRERDFDPACDCHECEVIARNRAFVTRTISTPGLPRGDAQNGGMAEGAEQGRRLLGQLEKQKAPPYSAIAVRGCFSLGEGPALDLRGSRERRAGSSANRVR